MSKSILITGGAGFIGSHVVKLFVTTYPQYRIVNLDALTYAGNLDNLTELEGAPNYFFEKADIQEGQVWEAFMYAAGKKVDNLIATIDYNKKQIDGSIDEVLPMGNLSAKLKAFDWIVLEEFQGNNLEAVINTLKRAKELTGKGKPIAIILHTEMGNGVDYMMGTHKWHGSAPNDEQLAAALSQNPETLGDY